MGFITGIKAITDATELSSASFVKNLKLEDGQAVKLRLISEFDPSSPHYDPARGLAGVFKQHQSPFNWMNKAECTMDDLGRCYACEKAAELRGTDIGAKWRVKRRFYTNVLVDDGMTDPYVAVWNLATYRSPNYEAIKDRFMDTGSVSNVTWRLKRSGKSQNDTTYVFQVIDIDSTPYEWPDLEPYALAGILPAIPYEEQEAFYNSGNSATVSNEVEEPRHSTDTEWI